MSTLLERARQKKQALSGGAKHHKLVVGKNKMRIMPSWRGEDEDFWHEFGIHWVKQPGSDKPKAVHICNTKTFGTACPICEALDLASRQAFEDDETKAITESSASQRVLMNALVGPNLDQHAIVEFPASVAGTIMGFLEEEDYGDVTHKDTGRVLTITGVGEGKNRKYTVLPAAKTHPVTDEQVAGVANLDLHVKQDDPAKLADAVRAVHGIVGVVGDGAAIESTGNVRQIATSRPAIAAQGSTDFEEDSDFDEVSPDEAPAASTKEQEIAARKAAFAAEMAALEDVG